MDKKITIEEIEALTSVEELERVKNEQEIHHSSKEGKAIKARIEELQAITGESEKEESLKEKEEDQHPVLSFHIDPDKTYEFRLKKAKKSRKNIPRESVVWDEHENRPREIRYCKTEPSPYKEDQGEYSRVSALPIVFKNGVAKIKGTDEAAIRYLLAYDGMEGKQKVMPTNLHLRNDYYLHDYEAAHKAARSREEAILDAKSKVRNASQSQLEEFICSRFGYDRYKNIKGDALVEVAYDLASKYPLDFNRDFDKPDHKVRVEIAALFDNNIIQDTNGVISWVSSKSEITKYNPAKDGSAIDVLTKWVLGGSDQAKRFREVYYSKTK